MGITMNCNNEIMDEISDCLLDNKPLPEGYTVNILSCEYTHYGWFDGFETKYIVTAPNGDVCNDSVELLDEIPLGEYFAGWGM